MLPEIPFVYLQLKVGYKKDLFQTGYFTKILNEIYSYQKRLCFHILMLLIWKESFLLIFLAINLAVFKIQFFQNQSITNLKLVVFLLLFICSQFEYRFKFPAWMFGTLKVVFATFLLFCLLSLSENTCQTRKNVFYFNSKAHFVIEKIKV